jgi:hypothetical protein
VLDRDALPALGERAVEAGAAYFSGWAWVQKYVVYAWQSRR